MFVDRPFPVPDTLIVDATTGLSINVPLWFQIEPEWIKNHQDDYRRILAYRERLGITVDDTEPLTAGPDEKIDLKPRTKPVRLPKRSRRTRKAKANAN